MFGHCSPPPAYQESQGGFAGAEDVELRADGFKEDRGTAATTSLDTKVRAEPVTAFLLF